MYSYSSEKDGEEVSAFLVTYIGVSLFPLFLPLKLCRKSSPNHPVLQTADLFASFTMDKNIRAND
jgi:hypothetical protein